MAKTPKPVAPPPTKPVIVKQIEGAEVATEILAKDIVDVAAAVRAFWNNGRMSKRAIALLIQDAAVSRIGIGTIMDVLNAAERLEKHCIKPS